MPNKSSIQETIGALAFTLPQTLSWTLGAHSGNDMISLLTAITQLKNKELTFSVTCIVETGSTPSPSGSDE